MMMMMFFCCLQLSCLDQVFIEKQNIFGSSEHTSTEINNSSSSHKTAFCVPCTVRKNRTQLIFRHRLLLLKLDKQTRSHLVVEVCIQRGICTVTHPPLMWHPTPSKPYASVCCKNWPVDGATSLCV